MALPGALALDAALGVIGKVVGALQTIPDAVRGLVDAFNPGAVRQLDMAFRSLQATVGYALEPVIRTFTDVFRLLASEFNDSFTAMREVIEDLMQAGFNLLRPIVRLVAIQFENLIGLFRAFEPVLDPLLAALDGWVTVLGAVLQVTNQVLVALLEMAGAILSWVTGLGLSADSLTEAFGRLAAGVIIAADYLLRLVGATSLADKILNAATRTPGPGRPEGLRDQRVTSLEDVYRQRLLEAARAQGNGLAPQKSAADVMQEALKEYQKAVAQGDTTNKLLGEIVRIMGGSRVKEFVDKYAPPDSNARAAARAASVLTPLGLLQELGIL